MHFRDRGKSVQLVRTAYDKETKRPTTEVLGRLSRPALEVSDELKGKLTPEEAAEVERYRSRVARRDAVVREYAAANLGETLAQVLAWLDTVDAETAAAFAYEMQRPMGKLRKRLVDAAAGPA